MYTSVQFNLIAAGAIYLLLVYIATVILSSKERNHLKIYLEKYKGLYESEKERYKYNGWKNYETWNYKLWIDNHEGLHNYFCELSRELDLYDLQTALKDYIDENNPFNELPSEFCYSDLLGSAIDNIDFYCIAECLKEENQEIVNYVDPVEGCLK